MKSSGLKPTRQSDKRRDRLAELAESLPEASVEPCGEGHLALKVRKKTFGYYMFDHHGDGEVALCCKAAAGAQGRLVATHPDRYFVPAYLGARGWVSYRMNLPSLDWNELATLLIESYRLVAPKTLAAEIE